MLALAPARLARALAVVGSLATLGVAISFVARFDSGRSGLQFVTDRVWISALGIHYKLGLDGLNVLLILIATIVFAAAIVYAAGQDWDRPRIFYFNFALAESAVLGALCAQDLALFVVFFDLMLIPFYFLSGIWGGEDRIRATTKLVIYTLIGSFLMLVGAVATGVLAASDHHTPITFAISQLQALPLSHGEQMWIFGWLRGRVPGQDAAGPVARLAPRRVQGDADPGGRGVLRNPLEGRRLRLPADRAATVPVRVAVQFQTLMLIIALVSILWATVIAMTTPDARLVVAYSSVAQLGFIMLGIFTLTPQGAQGALIQMANHALVTVPLFFIVAAAAMRAGGSEKLADMGGIAFRAPVLATLALIVTLANLAMPGSSNFVGEFNILLGTFDSKLPLALIASLGVLGAAAYALRLYIRAMHNRVGAKVTSFEIRRWEAVAIVPMVLLILVFAFYPQFALRRSEPTVTRHGGARSRRTRSSSPRRQYRPTR